jgi:hypothetical protein
LNVKITSGHKEELEDSALLLDSDYSNPQQDAERQVPTEIVINVIKMIPFGACFDGLGCCVTNRTTHSAGLLFGSLGPFFFSCMSQDDDGAAVTILTPEGGLPKSRS